MNFSTHYVQPTELDLNKAESWNFNIAGDITTGISFSENHQLRMEIAINLYLQEYASNTYEVKKRSSLHKTPGSTNISSTCSSVYWRSVVVQRSGVLL